jgi:hypothetical protein
MSFEDRVRSSADAALDQLTTRVDQDLRAIVQQLIALALAEQDAVARNVREVTLREAAADTKRQVAEAEALARVREREAEMAGVARLLDNIRRLDAATTLSEVLDGLAQGTAQETERAAVLVVRQDRLIGWRLIGFGDHDAQPRAIEIGLAEGGVVNAAVAESRPVTTGQAGTPGPGFANLSEEQTGLAVPVNVGGRAVAVVYTDSVALHAHDHQSPSGWPEVVEVLARHAARCLEALTVQKTVNAATPRFWMQAANRPGATA